MDPRERTGIGADADGVSLHIDGKQVLIYQSYEVKIALLQQPSAFSLRCGWSRSAGELLKLFKPGREFQLFIAGSPIMTGKIDAREIPEGKTTVIDGPFTEAKELIAGFWLWHVKSLEEAVEWIKRMPNPDDVQEAEIEIRQVFEADEFGAEYTPELREQDDRLRAQIEANTKR